MQPTDNPEEPISESGQTPSEGLPSGPMPDISDTFLTPMDDLSEPVESRDLVESTPAFEPEAPPPLSQPVIPEIMPEGAAGSKPPRKTSTGVILLVVFLLLLCCCCVVTFVILWNIGDFLLTTLSDILNSIFNGGIQIY